MDRTTEQLVEFAFAREAQGIPDAALHACKQRIVDTFASAVGGWDEELCRMAREVAADYTGKPPASVLGCGPATSMEAAAFANGVMLRYLDISDTFMTRSRGHPSDVLAGIGPVAEAFHIPGARVLAATLVAYDVYYSFCEALDFNSKGWDNGMLAVISTAIGVGRILDLDRGQMGNAIALALAPNMPLEQTRRGQISAWKGCSAANAARNAVFAVMLARRGFTGPNAIFEGKSGLWDAVGRFELKLPGPDDAFAVARSNLKCFPICYHGQSAVWAAFELRKQLNPADIREIRIDTYRQAVGMMGSEPSRWAPQTRETADHSLPYVTAVALLDGEVESASFAEERLADQRIRDLMAKTTVSENPDYSAAYPESAVVRVTVVTSSATHEVEVRDPKGHLSNPLDDADLEDKFRRMFAGYGPEAQCREALSALWNVDRLDDFGRIMQVLKKRT